MNRTLAVTLLTLMTSACSFIKGGSSLSDDASQITLDQHPLKKQILEVSNEEFKRLASYARVQKLDSFYSDTPHTERYTPWSNIVDNCQNRAMGLQYSLLMAEDDQLRSQTPDLAASMTAPVMTDYRYNEEQSRQEAIDLMTQKISRDQYTMATINVTGPLATQQTLVGKDGSTIGDSNLVFWPYHHGVVLNVEGELKVMDLSYSDEPIAIADWFANFTSSDVKCQLVPDVEKNADSPYFITMTYWRNLFEFGKVDPWLEEMKEYDCAYTITPAFKFSSFRDDPNSSILISYPFSMMSSMEGFKNENKLETEDVPHILSRYESLSMKDVCEQVSTRNFCKFLGFK